MGQEKRSSTIAYVDGYNLYHGIIDRRNVVPHGYRVFSNQRPWGDLLWLNLEKFIISYGFRNTTLEKIKFFEAPSFRPKSLQRQQVYRNALLSLDTMDQNCFFGGEFKSNDSHCRSCGTKITHYTEKKTDVLLAIELMSDFYLNRCDSAILICGDTDQIPTIEKIKSVNPSFPIYIIFPPHRRPMELRKIVGSTNTRKIKYERLAQCQFPDNLTVDGFEVSKPTKYLNQEDVN